MSSPPSPTWSENEAEFSRSTKKTPHPEPDLDSGKAMATQTPGDKATPKPDDHDQDQDHDDDATAVGATPSKQPSSSSKPGGSGRAKTGGRASQAKAGKDGKPEQQFGKIRHLKKEDGEPLWRADIQYDFLKAIFDDEKAVFTNSYDPKGLGKQTFADLYIDTMARSTKTSKVLRDKLLSDREAAKGMAMVCLLVNVGRMNTTLNCTSSEARPSPV